MTKITEEEVLKLAQLSMLELSDEQLKRFSRDINSVVEYVKQLQSVDVSGLETTDQVTGLVNVMRPDEITEYDAKPDELLKGAPQTKEHQIKVKRVL
jgi:aspartyl-tRNA(Asn)/glutamyl-tRNA(Gln) amidotransferase subunit C